MKSRRKLFAVVAVVIIIAAFGLARAVDYILAQNRDQVRQELQKVIGKDLSFAGLEAVWWGRPGFVAREFRILDDPHFAATPLVSAKELILSVSLWNLLFQRLVITRLTFVAPELQIIINEAGALNLASLLERKNELRDFPTLKYPARPEHKRGGINFSIARIDIQDGRVDYIDRSIKEPAELGINHLRLSLKGFESRAAVEVRLAASLTEGLNQDLRIEGRLDPAPDGRSWTRREVHLNLQFDSLYAPVVAHAISGLRDKIPSELNVTGPMALKATARGTPERPRIEDIALKIPLLGSSDYNAILTGRVDFTERRSWDDAEIQGKLAMESLPVNAVRSVRWLETIFPEGLTTEGSIGAYTAFEGVWNHLRIGALIRADKAELRYKELLRKPINTPAEIRARIYRQDNKFVFQDSEVIVNGIRNAFSGALVYGNAPVLQILSTAKQTPIAGYNGLFQPSDFRILAGKADWRITFTKTLMRGDDNWSMRGELMVTGAHVGRGNSGAALSNLEMKVLFRDKQARFDQVRFRMGKSLVSLQAIAENIEQPRATFTLSSARVNLAEVPSLAASPPVELDQVDAKGEFQVQNDGPLVTGSIRAARADLYPFRAQNLRSDIVLTAAAFSFKNLSAEMANGTLHSDGYWAPSGGRLEKLDFTSKIAALDLRELAAQFLPVMSGRLAGWLSGQARFTAALPNGANIKDALESSGEASVQHGTIRDFNLIAQLLLRGSGSNISRTRLPASLTALVEHRDTTFDSLKTNFTLEQKRIRTDSLVITTPEYTLTGAGWVGFDRSTNWNGLLIFSPGITQEFQRDYRFVRRFLDRRGRLAVSFRLDGKIPNVRIRLDNRALAQAIGTTPGQDKESDSKPGQEPKEVKRWIPDAIERFLKR
jgi:uncharacterized protein involved in outer membrane biogenesis